MCSRIAPTLLALSTCALSGLAVRTPAVAAAHDPFETAFVEVLDTLADGPRESALEALVALEQDTGESGDDNGDLERTRKREESILRRMSRRSPDALLPPIVLHIAAVRAHLEDRDPLLAVQSRILVGELVDQWVESSPRSDAAALGSVLLTRLAAEQIRARASGEAVLRRALELDPSNRAALLGVGRAVEKSARYEEAVAVLSRLVATAPESFEGRLRLAVGQRRLGSTSEARAQLETLVAATEAPDWLRSLAYQELALSYQQLEEWDRAVLVLDDGLGQLPNEQPLGVQLAYVLERSGRPREAGRVLATLQAGVGAAARDRYNEPPALDEVLSEIPEAARVARLIEESRPVLRAALERLHAKEAGP